MLLIFLLHKLYTGVFNCYMSTPLVIFLASIFVGVPSATYAAHVYYVQPDDVCKQQFCNNTLLKLFINNVNLFPISNSIVVFAAGDYFHNHSDLIVRDVTNLSLIGAPNTSHPTSPVTSVIKCLPDHGIHFYNVCNLLIKDIKFEGCSSSSEKFTQRSDFRYKHHSFQTSMYFNNCTNLNVVNVFIENPLGYALVGYNVMGNTSLEYIIVTMGTQTLNTSIPYACSFGIHWSYNDSESNKYVFVYITKIQFVYPNTTNIKFCYDYRSIIEVIANRVNAFVSITESKFSVRTHGSIIKININSSSYSRVDFLKCTITGSTLSHFIDFLCTSNALCTADQDEHCAKALVTFKEISFFDNTLASSKPKSMLQFVVSSCLRLKLNIVFSDVVYSRNSLALLSVTSHNHQSSVLISTFGTFVACHNNFLYDSLIFLKAGKMSFNSMTYFEGNYATELISLNDAQLEFSGNTKILTTNVYTLISLTNGKIHFKGSINISLNIVYILIELKDGQMYLSGFTKFSYNHATEIIHLSSSILCFSNNTVFDNNDCDQLLTLYDPEFNYLKLLGNAKLIFTNNSVRNKIIKVFIPLNNPNPFCLFQYYSPVNGGVKDFHISLTFHNRSLNDAKFIKEIDSIRKLTSQCKWVNDAAFQNYTPFVINSKTIHISSLKNDQILSYQLSLHSAVCYCRSPSNYDCNTNHLGPIYPGQTLSVDLCLPHNSEKVRILYAETRTDNVTGFSCKISNSDKVKHVLRYNQTKTVYFTFTSKKLIRECHLLFTVQPSLFQYYDTFNVHLLHCPLGFALIKGACDCDPHLSSFIADCKICDKTVRRLSNVYISGIVSKNLTHRYVTSMICPTDYCHEGSIRINLSDPDSQCQPHRTGLLCSVCERSYSMVFGSRQCRKCSNWHLGYVIFILLTGLFLVFLLFFFNSTVTTGTTNGIIFYVNTVHIFNCERD